MAGGTGRDAAPFLRKRGVRPGGRNPKWRTAPVLTTGWLAGLALGGCGAEEGPIATVSLPAVPILSGEPTGAVRVIKGVAYGEGRVRSGRRPLLADLYLPAAECRAPRPAVVLIHGGGFRIGSRAQLPWPVLAGGLAEAGFVAASIDYRLAGQNPTPSAPLLGMGRDLAGVPFLGEGARPTPEQVAAALSAFEDTAAAISWLQREGAAYCADPTRLALWGASAGAITALHVAYAFDDYGIEVTRPGAVVALWGGLARDSHLERGEPPLFLVHGDADPVVPHEESLELEARARRVGVPVILHTVGGAGHGFFSINLRTERMDGMALLDHIRVFLQERLGLAAPRG